MTEYIFHTASNNERWDTLAYKYYRNSYKIQPIIEANPHIKADTVIPQGTVLKIPIEKHKKTDKSVLPVWKR